MVLAGLVALGLLVGGGTVGLDGDAAALATGGSKPTGGVDAARHDGGGDARPRKAGKDGPTAQAGGGAIGSGGEF
jgi:hypothetical protein